MAVKTIRIQDKIDFSNSIRVISEKSSKGFVCDRWVLPNNNCMTTLFARHDGIILNGTI